MTATQGQAARDLQAEQDHAEWRGWTEAQGYDFDDDSYQAEAFAAGMQAERDLAATPGQPAPVSPHLECTVCASGVTTPHGAGGTPGQAARETFIAEAEPAPFGFTAWDELPDDLRGKWARIAQAAIAAQEPHAAPGPAGCECGHAQTGHAFSDDVCAVPDCPCPGYRPAPQPAPELAASDGDCAECDTPRVVCAAHARSQSSPEVSRELATAMAETRHLRADLRTLADLWDASSNRDEESALRPNRAALVLEERATTRRQCAADIRKLAGPTS